MPHDGLGQGNDIVGGRKMPKPVAEALLHETAIEKDRYLVGQAEGPRTWCAPPSREAFAYLESGTRRRGFDQVQSISARRTSESRTI